MSVIRLHGSFFLGIRRSQVDHSRSWSSIPVFEFVHPTCIVGALVAVMKRGELGRTCLPHGGRPRSLAEICDVPICSCRAPHPFILLSPLWFLHDGGRCLKRFPCGTSCIDPTGKLFVRVAPPGWIQDVDEPCNTRQGTDVELGRELDAVLRCAYRPGRGLGGPTPRRAPRYIRATPGACYSRRELRGRQ